MPVTARLSRKFYEKLGEDIAQEFVDWFNMVDATYREDLRETNELNFARFDAKLEQRTVELGTRIDKFAAELSVKIDERIGELNAKIDKRISAKFDERIGELNATIEWRTDGLDRKIDQLTVELADVRKDIHGVDKQVAAARADVIKWSFVFWTETSGKSRQISAAI